VDVITGATSDVATVSFGQIGGDVGSFLIQYLDEDDYHWTPRQTQRRRRYEEPDAPHEVLIRMILNIASSTKLPQDEAVEIAELLRDNFDVLTRAEFFEMFVQLIIEQPFKIPFVAAVAFYGNQVKTEIATEALKYAGDKLQECLNAGEWKEFKLLLRFFACLQPLYEDDGVFTFLGQLFDTVVDLQSANENDVR